MGWVVVHIIFTLLEIGTSTPCGAYLDMSVIRIRSPLGHANSQMVFRMKWAVRLIRKIDNEIERFKFG